MGRRMSGTLPRRALMAGGAALAVPPSVHLVLPSVPGGSLRTADRPREASTNLVQVEAARRVLPIRLHAASPEAWPAAAPSSFARIGPRSVMARTDGTGLTGRVSQGVVARGPAIEAGRSREPRKVAA